MSKEPLHLLTIGVSIVLASCSFVEDCKSVNFSSLVKANRMRIATHMDQTIRETSDQNEIASLVKFMSARTDHWCKPWAGSPIGYARAELYVDKRFIGSVSLGNNFAGTGFWRIRSLKKAERDELLRIFAIPDPYSK